MEEQIQAIKQLELKYGMDQNVDVLCSLAEMHAVRFQWSETFALTTHILNMSPNHTLTLALHIACMHHLPGLRPRLFILAHELVHERPEDAISWFAVGMWYFSGRRWATAREHLSKATLLDNRFAPAWLAFAHAFALEGEHDQAITAYSTAAKLFPGYIDPLTSFTPISELVILERILLSCTSPCNISRSRIRL